MEQTAAKINNNIVEQVIVGSWEWATEFLGGVWVDATGQQVGINFTYHGDHFRSPQPFLSWVWNNYQWNSPIPYPENGQRYYWDEDTVSWILVENI